MNIGLATNLKCRPPKRFYRPVRRPIQLRLRLLTLVLIAALPAMLGEWSFAQIFHIHRYTESNGLPATNVYGVVQSADGQMWFATSNGIARYDGQSWLIERSTDGLASTHQKYLGIDDKQRIWALAAGRRPGVSIFENGVWRTLPQQLDIESAHALYPLGGSDCEALVGHNDGLVYIKDGQYKNVKLNGSTIFCVYSFANFAGQIFAATDLGLMEVKLDSKPELKLVPGSPAIPIKGLASDSNRSQLWVIGRDWLGSFDGQIVQRIGQGFDDAASKSYSPIKATIGPNGGLYFGTRTGLFCHQPGKPLIQLGKANGLASDGMRDLCFDQEGLLWVTSPQGVSKLISFRFANYYRQQGLYGDEVSAVLHRPNGSTVLGHDGGLTFMNGPSKRMVRLGPQVTARVHDLAEDTKGNIWIAAYESGLFQIDDSGRTRHYPFQPEWKGHVSSVFVDQDDQLWLGTTSGVLKREGDRFVKYPIQDGAGITSGIRRIFQDREGRILVARFRCGISRLDTDGAKTWRLKQSDPKSNIWAYLDRPDGRQWVGTSAGLCELAVNGPAIAKLAEPQVDRPVYFLVEDQQQNTWIGTDNGVMRWDGKRLKHYSVEHGLAGRETNRAAAKIDQQGKLWIGTSRGLSIYNRELDRELNRAPSIQLIRVHTANDSWSPGKTREISIKQNALTFDYQAISFLDEDRIQVRSWLEGFEPGWQSATRTRESKIHFDFLPPGKYRLHLQAANMNGQWSEVVSTETFRINPPFWHTTWFYVLMGVSIAGIGFCTHLLFSQSRYRKRLEKEVVVRVAELRQSELRFGVTLSSIADGVITAGLNNEILFMNPAAETIFGQSFSSIRNQSITSIFVLSEEVQSELGEFLNHAAQGSSWSSKKPLRIKTPNNSNCVIEISTAPLKDSKKQLLGTVIAVRDVSERIRLEKELVNSQKLASLGTLAGGIAHDFNNLMSVIKWNVQLISGNPDNSVSPETIELVEGALKQAQSLTQQLLTFSKGGSPILQACQLDTLILDAVSFVSNDPEIGCDIDIAEDLYWAEIDPLQISQVLNNILINAKQSMRGGGLIQVRSKNRLVQGENFQQRFVQIEIQDSGIGIPKDQIERVFEPYFTTKERGHGIGLATSHSIIQRHHGKLSVVSEEGCGCTFRIELPAAKKPTNATKPTKNEEPPDEGTVVIGPASILIVDDDEAVRRSMEVLLSSIGLKVTAVGSGLAAIDVYQREFENGRCFHGVLIDLTMQGIDGRETMERLLDIDPDVRGILISGYSDTQIISNYKAHGFVNRLFKPCSLEELKSVLADLSPVLTS